ncbi:hypothetical protein BV741P2_00048 [Phocaeicola phage BV741P2]|nr:hypothetical protein BV741P2_00048 [Phocaeicola phage BV741P2]
MKKYTMKVKMWFSTIKNILILKRIANLRTDARVEMTQDEQRLLASLVEKLEPSNLITRNGKITYKAPALEDVTLWDMLETRRSEGSVERIRAWTGGKYSPDTVTDCIKLNKYILEQLKDADNLEEMIFNQPKEMEESESDPIKEAKALLGLIQITAELFQCSFEEAKKVNYTDSVLAMSKRMEEIEKEKSKIKNMR